MGFLQIARSTGLELIVTILQLADYSSPNKYYRLRYCSRAYCHLIEHNHSPRCYNNNFIGRFGVDVDLGKMLASTFLNGKSVRDDIVLC